MKISKIALTATLGTLGVLSLASCSKNKTIAFYSSAGDSNAPLLQEVITKFNENSGSDWKIELVNPGGGYDGLKDAITGDIQAGTVPGVAMCYADHVAEYLTAEVVLDMNKYIKDPSIGLSQEVKDDIIKGYWDEGWKAFGGKSEDEFMYTLPLSKSTEVMYYNKTALDLYNQNIQDNQSLTPEQKKELIVDYSTINTWTWDQFWAICDRLKSKDNGNKFSKWTPLGYDSESNFMITLAEQMGIPYTSATGDHYLFNNDQNVELLKQLKGHFEKGLYTMQPIYGKYTSNLFTKKRDAETQYQWHVTKTNTDGSETPVLDKDGKQKVELTESCFFSIGSTAGAKHQMPKGNIFEVGIAPIPQADPNNPKSINQGPSLVMFDQGSDKDAEEKERVTWLFVKELLDVKFQAKYSMNSGYVPVRKSVMNEAEYSDWFKEEGNIIAKTVEFCLQNSNSYFVSPAFNGSNKARTKIGAVLVEILTKGTDIKEALTKAEKYCEF